MVVVMNGVLDIMSRFLVPWAEVKVYFRAERDRLVVMAVFHDRRDLNVWQSRA